MVAISEDVTMQMILLDVDLGKNIRNIRISRNMTQENVIAKIQLLGSMMSRSTLANIEGGYRNIKASDLMALKIIFDVDYSAFFEGL